jgi:HK97 family phage portal protein
LRWLGGPAERAEQSLATATPDSWPWDALTGGGRTSAGVGVSETTALNYSAVLACVKVLAETLACLPLHVYQRLDRGREKAHGHYAYRLLRMEPNPEMSSYTWREIMMNNAARWGNAYSLIDWTVGGRPRAIWPLRPEFMTVERVAGKVVYRYRRSGDRWSGPWAPDEVLHIRTLGDELVGYSPIRLARESIGTGIAASQFGAKLFSNGARVGGILQVPGRLKDRARFEADFNAKHESVQNAHRTLVIDDGSKWVSTSFPPDDAQFLETRKYQRSEVASIYRIPPHMIGDLDKATKANIEQQAIEFVQFTMLPWMTNWEQEITRKLLSGEFYAEFLTDVLLRGDSLSRIQSYNIGLRDGLYSINECREKENMNPIPGGDVHRIQAQMISVEEGKAAEEGAEE